MRSKDWFVYIVRCQDNSLYTGITIDVGRRLFEHNNLKSAAKYTKPRRPVFIVHLEGPYNESKARKIELQIKAKTKEQKERYIDEQKTIKKKI